MRQQLQHLGSDLFVLWAIATTSLCVGLLVNQFRERPLPLVYTPKEGRVLAAAENLAKSKVGEGAEQGVNIVKTTVLPETLSLEEFQRIVDNREALVLDARPEIFHRLGHVPGALSLPREDFEAGFERLRGVLEAEKARALVIYCSGSSCEDSELVRKGLLRLGFTQVSIFVGGWAKWKAAGLPEEVLQ